MYVITKHNRVEVPPSVTIVTYKRIAMVTTEVSNERSGEKGVSNAATLLHIVAKDAFTVKQAFTDGSSRLKINDNGNDNGTFKFLIRF